MLLQSGFETWNGGFLARIQVVFLSLFVRLRCFFVHLLLGEYDFWEYLADGLEVGLELRSRVQVGPSRLADLAVGVQDEAVNHAGKHKVSDRDLVPRSKLPTMIREIPLRLPVYVCNSFE